ncbi:hypothetical protein KHQ81_01245 [Mycoplasmatota bacterium]|nr:hypothetical protein KHQ81_01245 [Mycoplasmatota bacterium]
MCKKNIVFLGDSITAGFTLLENYDNVVNLGVSGDKTTEVLDRIHDVFQYNPEKLIILIGINDFLVNKKVWFHPTEINIPENFQKIIEILRENLPDTKFYSISTFPLGKNELFSNDLLPQYNQEIDDLNNEYKRISEKYHVEFLNISHILKDDNGILKDEYTLDGVHLTEAGYKKYLEAIKELL